MVGRRSRAARAVALLLLAVLLRSTAEAQPPVWAAQGPGPNTSGQVENIKDRPVTGAVNAVAVHPTNADVVYAGAVNGGVWVTADATAAAPTWKRLTDGQASLSIGALEMDPRDLTRQTLVAGIGRFSSFIGDGGARTGLLRTTNGGNTWTALDGGGVLRGLNVSGVAPRGDTIVLSANAADLFGKEGVWRSTSTGTLWKQVSGAAGSGLPAGASATLAGNAKVPARLFTNAGNTPATVGIYRSDDTGATWKRVSTAAMNALLGAAQNVKIAVGAGDEVYAVIVDSQEVIGGVFRSADAGATWTSMGVPATADGVGAHPGGQGGIHLAVAADPQNPNLVYVGGDRQNDPFPNVIGAKDYSGRLFRGDASKPAGKQWAHLTHQKQGDGGTANSSAPHADARALRVAANGVLIHGNDGGVYRRTSPQTNAGDWFSINGNLAVAEFHAIAWDSNAKVVIGGAQDTGTPQQTKTASPLWQSVAMADGGCVAVDDRSAVGQSTRYSSSQNLGGFRRRVYSAANVLQSETFPMLAAVGGALPPQAQFYTPIRLNTVTRTRLIIGAQNGVYESFDRADSVAALTPPLAANGLGQNAIAYGAKGNADMLYVGSGATVFVRKAIGDPLAATPYAGGFVLGIAIDPGKADAAVAVSANRVSRTADGGGSWTDVTGNLAAVGAGRLRSVAFVTSSAAGAAVVGTDTGVFLAAGPLFNTWSKLGTGLPRAPVFSLEYDPADTLLLAGTLGRGAWTVSLAGVPGVQPVPPDPPAKLPAPAGPPAKGPPAPPPKTEPKDMPPFQLRPGLVVAADRKAIYTMAPDGGVDALNTASGQPLWQSKEAARPLGVVRGRVVAQAEPGAGRDLKLVPLDPADGKPGPQGTVAMPAGVRATVQATAAGAFAAGAAPAAAGGDAVVTWQFTERPRRGLPPGTRPTLTPPGGGGTAPALAAPAARQGEVRLNVLSGATSAAGDAPAMALVGGNTAAAVPPPQQVPGVAGRQLFSADRRHVLVSEVVAPTAWNGHRLTVFDLQGKRLGEFRSHLAAVPFFVAEGLVIFETTPYRRRPAADEPGKPAVDADGLIEEPAKVRAVNLATGVEAWSRPVREVVYRGPLPP